MFTFIRKNFLFILATLIVGTVSVLPQIISVVHLGNEYKGIPFIYTANEDTYLARIREVVDGHPLVGSAFFYEYKNWRPIVPAIGENLYAIPTLLFSVPLLSVLAASKFVLPAVLFILVSLLILRLSTDPQSKWTQINAVVGGLIVTLGYDIFDYQHFYNLLVNPADAFSLSVWTRPINPILGAIFLFVFLLLILKITEQRKKIYIIPAAIVWALSVGYIFSWTLILAIVGLFILLFIIKKDFTLVKQLVVLVLLWLVLTLPYWYGLVSSLNNSVAGVTAAARNGIFLTHRPIINKITLAFTLVFLGFSGCFRWCKRDKNALENWWYALAIFMAASWAAFNQQIITGRTVWYHHYVQYTIPLGIVVVMVLLNNWVRPVLFKVWTAAIIGIVLCIGFYNFVDLRAIRYRYVDFKNLQSYAPILSWINKNAAKECVVLNQDTPVRFELLVSAFTGCDSYAPSWVFDGVPAERIRHDYLVMLRLRGISPELVGQYLSDNETEVRSYFFKDWDQMFGHGPDPYITEVIDGLAKDYTVFFKGNFVDELKKYKLDYILFVGSPSPGLLKSLPGITPAFQYDNFYLYRFN